MIARRAQSLPARHCDIAVTRCEGEVSLRLTWSAIRGYEGLVLIRCETCDAERLADHDSAPAVEVYGVVPDENEYDSGAWGV